MAAQRLDGIQVLRGLAALAVVVHHALEHSNAAARSFSPDWVTRVGAAGVDLFFVISGFIMMWTTFPEGKPPLTAPSFLYRRFVRIYPLYWITCAGILSISALGYLKSHAFDAETVLRSLLLLPGSAVVGVAWTLVFEMWFYVLFAALLPLRSRTASVLGVPALLVLAALAASLLPAGPTRSLLQSPLPIEFCFGLLLGYGARQLPIRRLQAALTWPAAALALAGFIGAAILVPSDGTGGLPAWPRAVVWGLPALLLVAASLAWSPQGRAGRALTELGNASYALYLSHVFVMIAYGRALKVEALRQLPQEPVVPAVVAASLAGGLAFHALCERPLDRFVRKVGDRVMRLRPAASPA